MPNPDEPDVDCTPPAGWEPSKDFNPDDVEETS